MDKKSIWNKIGKMSISFETEENVEEILARADTYLKTAGYNTKIKGYMLDAINGRDYIGWIAVLFLLILIIPFLAYWFTRKRNRIKIIVSQSYTSPLYSPSGIWKRITLGPSKVEIKYAGKKAERDAQNLYTMLRK